MRLPSKSIPVLAILLASILQACSPAQNTAAQTQQALSVENDLRTQVVAEVTMTAAQNALSAAQSTADAAVQTLAAPTSASVPTSTPQPAAIGSPAVVSPALTAVVAVSKMQLRDGPDLHFAYVADCYAGTSVSVIAKFGEWVYVQLDNGIRGWVDYLWLKFPAGVDINNVPDAVSIPNFVIPHKYP